MKGTLGAGIVGAVVALLVVGVFMVVDATVLHVYVIEQDVTLVATPSTP